MSLIDKIKEAVTTPISVSYKEKKEYSKLDMIELYIKIELDQPDIN